jgi:diguanylate cyclase (GGDEF)-like protein
MDAAVWDALPMAVVQLDADGRLVAANAPWRRLLAPLLAPDGEAVGLDYAAACERLALEGDVAAAGLAASLREVLAGRTDGVTRDDYRPLGGEPFWFRVDVRALPDGGAVVVHTDVTQQQRALDAAEAAARLDPLTGLLNRRALHEFLQERLARSGEAPAAVFLVDLDRFKEVNDRHGHAAGDLLLCALARRLRYALRPRDRVARIGGDEFLVLIERLPAEQPLAPVVTRLRRVLEQPVAVGTERVGVGASIGAIRLDGGIADVDGAIREADRRMYEDKRARRSPGPPGSTLLASAVALG